MAKYKCTRGWVLVGRLLENAAIGMCGAEGEGVPASSTNWVSANGPFIHFCTSQIIILTLR